MVRTLKKDCCDYCYFVSEKKYDIVDRQDVSDIINAYAVCKSCGEELTFYVSKRNG